MANSRIRTNSSFGNSPMSGNRQAIVGATNGFVTNDATATPVVSPLAYTTSVTTLNVPNNAVSVTLQPSTAMKLSELVSQAQYYTVAANAVETVGCAGMAQLFISGTAGTLQFRFNYM